MIKADLIGISVNEGYQIDKDTTYLLEMHRPTNSKEDMFLALTIGNSYSSNSRLLSFMFVPGSDSTRVIASSSIRAQLPGGQTNNMDLNDNGAVYNKVQQWLQDAKSQVESKK
jgi:hypothetical protein